jgi:RNA polymerase sigma factor (sigma-70 family)
MLYSNLSVNESGHLTIGGLDAVDLAAEYGTPLYVLDENSIREMCRTYITAARSCFGEDALPLYASKALCFTEIYRIAAEEGRDAGIAELAERCGVSVEEAAVSLDAMSPVTSLSEFVYGEDTITYENVIPDEESERESERICDRVALAQCIHRLPELWQKIVLMRYFRNMTQQQTGAALGLTQVKISREEKKLLAALREELS